LVLRGASALYPDAWEPYLAHIPEAERGDLLSAYYRRLTSEDPTVRLAAAKIWSGWEGVTSKLLPDPDFAGHYEEDVFALAFARIEVHYFFNKVSWKPTTSYCATPLVSATSPE
jgi:proline iminopeptidase